MRRKIIFFKKRKSKRKNRLQAVAARARLGHLRRLAVVSPNVCGGGGEWIDDPPPLNVSMHPSLAEMIGRQIAHLVSCLADTGK